MNAIDTTIMIGLGLFLLVCIFGIFRAHHLEKIAWNGGICKEHGTKWKCFDVDSQGGRGYKCGDMVYEHHIWISYDVDKTK